MYCIAIQVSPQSSNFVVPIHIALCLFESIYSNKKMYGKQKQATLGKFNFARSIQHRRQKIYMESLNSSIQLGLQSKGCSQRLIFSKESMPTYCVIIQFLWHDFYVSHNCFVWRTNNYHWCRHLAYRIF